MEAYEEEYKNKKSKKTRTMIKSLKNLRIDLRDMCLKLYLEKWRTEHNVAFFQWRENFTIEAKALVDKYSMKLLRSKEKEHSHLNEDDK